MLLLLLLLLSFALPRLNLCPSIGLFAFLLQQQFLLILLVYTLLLDVLAPFRLHFLLLLVQPCLRRLQSEKQLALGLVPTLGSNRHLGRVDVGLILRV